MELDLHIGTSGECRTEKERAEAVKKSADFWRDGNTKEAVRLLCEVFNEGTPEPKWFRPYVKEFGGEYRDLISKLYLLHISEDDEDWTEGALIEFEDEYETEGLVSRLANRIVGQKWEELREAFYERCPECMFMGDSDEPYSLKLRSENCIECIPADGSDLHELAKPAKDYGTAMDGYSFYEGHALVKDDPEAEDNYPPKIKAILKKIKARKLKYFPNVIFPLTNGENLLDTFRQMQELLQLLEHGWHFESISSYITDHPDLFPDIVKKRLEMLDFQDEDSDEDDDEIVFDLDDADFIDDDDDDNDDPERDKKR